MTEYMGLVSCVSFSSLFEPVVAFDEFIQIYGSYDAKKAGKGGFQPGSASLHRLAVFRFKIDFQPP